VHLSINSDGTEGLNPNGGLVDDPAGNLYGTTQFGGTQLSSGTIFELSKAGKLSLLFDFGGHNNNGATPAAGLVRDAAGNLYGTTLDGLGNVFRFTP